MGYVQGVRTHRPIPTSPSSPDSREPHPPRRRSVPARRGAGSPRAALPPHAPRAWR
ncbi:hypothetical protein F751_4545 [Auxenochlorella protothecoides]|uniref:Uncharacterized protein n=1 Tax=Auxenochlorella protothecoides TaxID=3075 RepID=A0A087SNH1_AUXPR|nr:hypothetical protein F751_4545 [Auxenochlorella protothecoides]KFM27275.1 hypothetical protein F751_4545 [Auxenochlorella protothecoides]